MLARTHLCRHALGADFARNHGMTRIPRRTLTTAALTLPLLPRRSSATDAPVRIGALYPLTGPSASSGTAGRMAIEVGVDIVNTAHPELPNLPLAPTVGLPNLGGRPIEVIFADHQANPSIAQSEALRLITQEKVVALVGAAMSSCTLTSSGVAERYGIPYVTGEATAPSLTERGFKWFFRTTPVGSDFGIAYTTFLRERKEAGFRIDKVALVNENTEYGSSTATAIIAAAASRGVAVTTHIAYAANATDVSAQVLQLKAAEPDCVIFVSYTSDAILFLKTMHTLNWKPPILIGDDSGFSDNAFIQATHDIAQGVINRNSFSPDKPGTNAHIVNDMFIRKTGFTMDDTSARGMQGFLAMAEAINRAGSTDPARIQAALVSQALSAEQLIMGYNGIKYDAKGQNTRAATLLVQLTGKKYISVWPEASAVKKVDLPFKGWN